VVAAVTWDPDGSGLRPAALYAAGRFGVDEFNMAAYGIAVSSGGTWTLLTPPLNQTIRCMVVGPDGRLIVGGEFTASSTQSIPYIAAWDGENWEAIGPGMNNAVTTLTVSSGLLYAGGRFNNVGPASGPFIATWDGETWQSVSASPALTNAPSLLKTLANGDVVAANFRWVENRFTCQVERLSGNAWTRLDQGATGAALLGMHGSDPAVFDLVELASGDLVAVGHFQNAGGVVVNNVARFNGTSWVPLGAGLDSIASSAALLRDQTVVVSGWFHSAGGVPANNLALWSPAGWAAVPGTGVEYVQGVFETSDGGALVRGQYSDWTGEWPVTHYVEARYVLTPTADFNGDGDAGTDQDIEAFFACLGGTCCPLCHPRGSDFNADGDYGTDQDIEAFFRVLGGGSC